MPILGGELVLDLIQSNGIEYIFCSPGSEWTPVWEGLARRYAKGDKTLKYINCRHESLAVSMAQGYTKVTNRMAAVLLHVGVGTLHAAMAIRSAYFSEIPMLIFTSETYQHVAEENVRVPGAQYATHLADIGGPAYLVKPYIKWSNAVYASDTLVDSTYRGCQIAQANPPGPVLISITKEFLQRTVSEIAVKPPPPVPSLPQPSIQVFEKAAQQLIESKQPIIITEYVGKKPETVSKLTELAELLSIPVFEGVYPCFHNFPKDHPLHMGYDASKALKEADTVFAVGSINPWYPPSTPRQDARLLFLDENSVHDQIPYWGYQFDLVMEADIGEGLTTLIDIIRNKLEGKDNYIALFQKRLEYWRSMHEQMVQQWEAEALAEEKNQPISAKWLFYTLNKIMPSNSVVMEETILESRVIRKYLTVPKLFVKSVTGGLGVGLGEALGLKLACQERPVIFLVGDGTFTYNPVLAGLGLSQEYCLPILTIIFNNGGYMAMKSGFHVLYPKGQSCAQNEYLGVDITPDPDYCKIAEAFGAYAEKVEAPENLKSALNRALQQIENGKSAVLDVAVDKGKFSFVVT